MAFWGLLVLLAFTGVWLITGTMERIPPQVLVLLGISGATGLGARVIGTSKTARQRTGAQSTLAKLQDERQALEASQLQDPAAFTQASKERLAAVLSDLERLRAEPAAPQSAGFWQDICDDGEGLSFHRLQVVLWTVVLGVVFVWSVAQAISMPEFSETLLTLMGISNGTYLGFKIPEPE